MASISPEKDTLQKCAAEISRALAYETDLVWFANRLIAANFITHFLQRNLQDAGVGNYSRASKLMESVITQVSITPSKYGEFLHILEEEPPLHDLVKLLNKTYAEITGKSHRHSQSVSRKRQTPKQSHIADRKQTISQPRGRRRQKTPAADQHSSSSSNAAEASSASSSSGTLHASPKSKGPLLLVLLVIVIIGGVAVGVLLPWYKAMTYEV